MINLHNECNVIVRSDEIMQFIATWIEIEDMLNEVSQKMKVKHTFLLICGI